MNFYYTQVGVMFAFSFFDTNEGRVPFLSWNKFPVSVLPLSAVLFIYIEKFSKSFDLIIIERVMLTRQLCMKFWCSFTWVRLDNLFLIEITVDCSVSWDYNVCY